MRGRLARTPEAIAKKKASLKRKWAEPEYRARMLEKRRVEGQRRSQRPPKEQLHSLYVEQGLSQDAIAAHLGVSQHAVSRYLRSYDIPTRRSPGRPRKVTA